ncbi:RNA-directed DNA polymerase, eukaryota [Tanacetum coccineum]
MKLSSFIFITNFPGNFSAKELWTVCNQYGSIVDAFIPDKRSKSGKRFGFVRFLKIFDIDRLVDNLCTIWVGRFKLHANIARFQRSPLNKDDSQFPYKGDNKPTIEVHKEGGENGSKSYAYAVRNDFIPVNMEKDVPAIVIDESCINQLEYPTYLMGKVKEFTSMTNLKAALAHEGFDNIKFKYMGGLWVMLQFNTEDSKERFKSNMGTRSWFTQLIQASNSFCIDERVAWVDIEGIPLKGWSKNTFSRISSKWGELLYFDDQEEGYLHTKRICIKTKLSENIYESFKIIIRGKIFWIRAKEVSGWIPEFEDDDDEDIHSDGEMSKDGTIDKNGGTFKFPNVEDESNCEEVAETIFENNHSSANVKEDFVGVQKDTSSEDPFNDEAQNNPPNESKEEGDNGAPNDVPNSKEDKHESNEKKDSTVSSSKNDTVGQAMGYNMEGCSKNIGDVIDFQGVNDETKMENIEIFNIKSCWGNFGFEYDHSHSVGEWLPNVINNWNGEVVIMGDFNEVRTQEERYGSIFNSQGAGAFNLFISSAGLEELLKGQIRIWIKANNDRSKKNKQDLKADLNKIDMMLDKGDGNSEILSKRMDVIKSLQELDKLDTMEMAQKTKIKWVIERDENSKYYHGILNKRRNQLAIRRILIEGRWIEDSISVKSEFYSHFANRFDKPPSYRLNLDTDFPNKLTIEQQSDLETNITREEIKKAVWGCGVDKSPGPDGFTFGFYRRYWSFMESDVVDAVLHFFHFGKFPKGSNSSFIALIPKTHDAKMMKDYCHITLIGSLYKIIAKVMANRMVVILGDIVNDVQSAFVANRQILDGPFILNELFQWCKKKKYQTMIFKVDFEKAYDSVRWDYLEDILKNFGFGEKWCGWIRNCLLSSKGSVIVNGSLTTEFQFQRGLKQGDPLSPFLFILIMESLHISMQRVVDAGMFKGIKLGNSLQVSHLFYADDAVFMGHWSESNLDTILRVLDCFYHASGLHINMIKSKLIGVAVSSAKVDQAANKIRCATLKVPFLYLEQNGKKQIWVKWSKVLAFKENGGLGVSSFYALNRALLFKWVNNHHPSLWLDIVKEVHNLQNQGIDLMGYILKKLGNGEDTLFWEDSWKGDITFKSIYPSLYALETNKNVSVASKLSQPNLATSFRRAPRGGLEDYQFSQLLLNMEGVSCTDVKDRWSWALTGCGDFSVASIRKSLDNHFLPVVASKTRWIHEVPIKVNILVWKVRMDGLPTRLNISKREMDIQSILCLIHDKEVESTSFLVIWLAIFFVRFYVGGI